MGGTSTDVSRYDGDYEHVFESTTAGVVIQAPQVQCLYVLLSVETFPFRYHVHFVNGMHTMVN